MVRFFSFVPSVFVELAGEGVELSEDSLEVVFGFCDFGFEPVDVAEDVFGFFIEALNFFDGDGGEGFFFDSLFEFLDGGSGGFDV